MIAYEEAYISTSLRLTVKQNDKIKRMTFNNIKETASNDNLILIGEVLFNLTSHDTLEEISKVTVNKISVSDDGSNDGEVELFSPIKLSDGKELVTSNGERILFKI